MFLGQLSIKKSYFFRKPIFFFKPIEKKASSYYNEKILTFTTLEFLWVDYLVLRQKMTVL